MAVSTIKAVQDTGWVTLDANSKYRVRNGICTVQINGASLTTSTKTFGLLPEEYRPIQEVDFLLRSGHTPCQAYITGGGYVRANASSSLSNCGGAVTFIVG